VSNGVSAVVKKSAARGDRMQMGLEPVRLRVGARKNGGRYSQQNKQTSGRKCSRYKERVQERIAKRAACVSLNWRVKGRKDKNCGF